MIDLNGTSVDLTAPPTSIGTTTPVAVNSTIFTALPANNTSAFVASGNTLTGSNSQSLVNLSQTWNTTGTPTAIFANITDTASNASSRLMDLQIGGISRFRISKSGVVDGTANFNTTSFVASFDVVVGRSLVLGSSGDVFLFRDAAQTLAQRNSAISQTYRLYKSFTDASNYTRAAWQFDANGVVLAGESAGTGDANIDITFTPKGTGNVRFGTHSAVAAEVITGYITIKDASGTLRKLAVIS